MFVIWVDIISDVDGEVVVWNENGVLISVIVIFVFFVVVVLCVLCYEWFLFFVVVLGMFLNVVLGFLF